MLDIKELAIDGYEEVLEITEPSCRLKGFIAIHSTILGPALGGLRMYPYGTPEEALEDVLRLAKGMTYKSALAELGLGGGKSVIIGDSHTDKTAQLLETFGEAVNVLNGRYICAEDVGTTTADMAVIRRTTPYVTALAGKMSSGDPSPFTAWGVYRGLQALAKTLWGDSALQNRTIAIQGLGKVGHALAEFLFWQGAHLVVSDLDADLVEATKRRYGALSVDPPDVFLADCDLFAPCAMGACLNETTIPLLRCRGIGGSANNQLATAADGDRLVERGILYAPDYVINAGGVINVAIELKPEGYQARQGLQQVNKIYDVLLEIFHQSKLSHQSTHIVADRLAQKCLSTRRGKRTIPIVFS
jgi:leucine dehydrogenase